jgi:hypothetical protein
MDKLKIPTAAGVSLEDRTRSYKRIIRNGNWVTNGAETGLILVSPNGDPVKTLTNKNIEVVWNDLQSSGASGLIRKFK